MPGGVVNEWVISHASLTREDTVGLSQNKQKLFSICMTYDPFSYNVKTQHILNTYLPKHR